MTCRQTRRRPTPAEALTGQTPGVRSQTRRVTTQAGRCTSHDVRCTARSRATYVPGHQLCSPSSDVSPPSTVTISRPGSTFTTTRAWTPKPFRPSQLPDSRRHGTYVSPERESCRGRRNEVTVSSRTPSRRRVGVSSAGRSRVNAFARSRRYRRASGPFRDCASAGRRTTGVRDVESVISTRISPKPFLTRRREGREEKPSLCSVRLPQRSSRRFLRVFASSREPVL